MDFLIDSMYSVRWEESQGGHQIFIPGGIYLLFIEIMI